MDPVQKPAVAGILMINSIRNVSLDRGDLEKKRIKLKRSCRLMAKPKDFSQRQSVVFQQAPDN